MIILVGFMGSGKTVWGQAIAKALHLDFQDLDDLLEQRFGMSIADMFENWGEERFREEESKLLLSIKNQKIVLATGGGTPLYNDGMNHLLNMGTVVFLDTPLDVLVERLQKEQAKRPLIKDIDSAELKNFIGKILEKRRQTYAKAHITVGTANLSLQEVINMLNS